MLYLAENLDLWAASNACMSNLQGIYFGEQWVAEEYLRWYRNSAWEESMDKHTLKCWNLEQIIEAEFLSAPKPIDLTMSDSEAEITLAE